MEAERAKELKRVAPRLLLGLLAVESFTLPVFRSGGRTGLSFMGWLVNHTIFGPPVEYVPEESYSRELEGTFAWYPVKEVTQTFRTMEEAMAYFKTDQAAVKEMLKNGAISIVAGDSKLKRYDDLLADVRHDSKYHSIRSLVQPNDAEVRDIARVLVQAPDFITAAQEFVNSFTTYRVEVGDYWCEPSETLVARAGDCVTSDTPVWVKYNGRPMLVEVRELLPVGDYRQFVGIDILTPGGFAPLISVRRKGIRETLRLLDTSDIGLTPEHKLLINPLFHNSDRYCEVSKVKHASLFKVYPELHNINYINNQAWEYEIGWAYGLFFADGSSGLRKHNTLGGESWRIVNANSDYLERASVTFSALFPQLQFPIRLFDSYKSGNTVQSSRFTGQRKKALYSMDALLRVDGNKGQRARIIRDFRNQVYNCFGIKRVPDFILNGTIDMARGFWDGVHAGDGSPSDTRVTCQHKLSTLGLTNVLRKIGQTPSITFDHAAVRVGPVSKRIEHQVSWRVENGYKEVFDIATERGEFVAGDVAVKNCDDKAILLCSILRNYIPPDRVYCAFGLWRDGGQTSGHMWAITEGEGGDDRILEATAPPSKPSKGKYILHGMFNDTYAFATDVGLREFDLKVVEMADASARR